VVSLCQLTTSAPPAASATAADFWLPLLRVLTANSGLRAWPLAAKARARTSWSPSI
jgi:hypothetical protein